MRQRKIKDIAEKLRAYDRLLYTAGEGERAYPAAETLLELGCGRGRFICAAAALYPGRRFVAAEGNTSIIYRAMQKVDERGLGNTRFIPTYINDIEEYFSAGSLSGLYLNFSDPWPKDRHEKRRLTALFRVEAYKRVLCAGGWVALKTDNEGFFEFSAATFERAGFDIACLSRDLHAIPEEERGALPPEAFIMTEYEQKFTDLGKRIRYMLARKV